MGFILEAADGGDAQRGHGDAGRADAGGREEVFGGLAGRRQAGMASGRPCLRMQTHIWDAEDGIPTKVFARRTQVGARTMMT